MGVGGGGTRRRGVQSADGGGTKRGTLRFFAAARVPPSKKSPPCRKSAQISTKSTLVATRLHNFTIGSILRVKNAIFVPMKIRRRHFTCGGWETTSYYFLGAPRRGPPPHGELPLPPAGGYSPPSYLSDIKSLNIMKKQALLINNPTFCDPRR